MQSAPQGHRSMTEQQFLELEPNQSVYDYRTSKRRKTHIFGIVRGKCKVTGDMIIYIEGIVESLPVSNCYEFDKFDPEEQDISTLPFY